MISKAELEKLLIDCSITNSILEKRIEDLYAIIARKDAIIDVAVFNNYEKFNDARDFNTYDEFMSSIFDQPIATCKA